MATSFLIKSSSGLQVMRTHHEKCLYNFDPLKPHFYIVKLGFTGVNIIFLISALNIDFGYSLEPPHRGGSNEYPQSMFGAEIWQISDFFSKYFHFLVVKVSVYLNRYVFVMRDNILNEYDFVPEQPTEKRVRPQFSHRHIIGKCSDDSDFIFYRILI